MYLKKKIEVIFNNVKLQTEQMACYPVYATRIGLKDTSKRVILNELIKQIKNGPGSQETLKVSYILCQSTLFSMTHHNIHSLFLILNNKMVSTHLHGNQTLFS